MEDDIGRAIRILNELLEADPAAISKIVGYRIETTDKLAAHPTAQCGRRSGGKPTIGLLGIVNALFGVGKDQLGHIMATEDDDGRILEFLRRPEKPMPEL